MFQRGIHIGRLVSLEGSAVGISFYLWGKSYFLIGSSPEADVYLTGHKVSPHHAKIEKEEDQYILTDLSQGNTLVNGEVIDIGVLEEGDHLRIGFNIMVFNYRHVTEENFMHIQEDLERFNLKKQNENLKGPHLLVLSGTNEGYRYPLSEKKNYTIGRSSTSDIKILDAKMSRIHCKIESEEGVYIIFDNQSTNGIFINGEQKDIHHLQHGDHIRVGFTVLEFRNL